MGDGNHLLRETRPVGLGLGGSRIRFTGLAGRVDLGGRRLGCRARFCGLADSDRCLSLRFQLRNAQNTREGISEEWPDQIPFASFRAFRGKHDEQAGRVTPVCAFVASCEKERDLRMGMRATRSLARSL